MRHIEINQYLVFQFLYHGLLDGNYLIDVDGQKIERNQNGDFIYLYNNKKIIIQNFDVQNPKLRIYGTRQRYSSLCSELSLHSQFSNKKFSILK